MTSNPVIINLCKVIRDGNQEELLLFLESLKDKPDISFGLAPLTIALAGNQLGSLRLLLEFGIHHGIDPSVSYAGWNPKMLSVYFGNFAASKIIAAYEQTITNSSKAIIPKDVSSIGANDPSYNVCRFFHTTLGPNAAQLIINNWTLSFSNTFTPSFAEKDPFVMVEFIPLDPSRRVLSYEFVVSLTFVDGAWKASLPTLSSLLRASADVQMPSMLSPERITLRVHDKSLPGVGSGRFRLNSHVAIFQGERTCDFGFSCRAWGLRGYDPNSDVAPTKQGAIFLGESLVSDNVLGGDSARAGLGIIPGLSAVSSSPVDPRSEGNVSLPVLLVTSNRPGPIDDTLDDDLGLVPHLSDMGTLTLSYIFAHGRVGEIPTPPPGTAALIQSCEAPSSSASASENAAAVIDNFVPSSTVTSGRFPSPTLSDHSLSTDSASVISIFRPPGTASGVVDKVKPISLSRGADGKTVVVPDPPRLNWGGTCMVGHRGSGADNAAIGLVSPSEELASSKLKSEEVVPGFVPVRIPTPSSIAGASTYDTTYSSTSFTEGWSPVSGSLSQTQSAAQAPSGVNPVAAPRRRRTHILENTLLSLTQAAKQGVNYIEFDVQLTRDAIPVVHHDWTVIIDQSKNYNGLGVPVDDVGLASSSRKSMSRSPASLLSRTLPVAHNSSIVQQPGSDSSSSSIGTSSGTLGAAAALQSQPPSNVGAVRGHPSAHEPEYAYGLSTNVIPDTSMVGIGGISERGAPAPGLLRARSASLGDGITYDSLKSSGISQVAVAMGMNEPSTVPITQSASLGIVSTVSTDSSDSSELRQRMLDLRPTSTLTPSGVVAGDAEVPFVNTVPPILSRNVSSSGDVGSTSTLPGSAVVPEVPLIPLPAVAKVAPPTFFGSSESYGSVVRVPVTHLTLAQFRRIQNIAHNADVADEYLLAASADHSVKHFKPWSAEARAGARRAKLINSTLVKKESSVVPPSSSNQNSNMKPLTTTDKVSTAADPSLSPSKGLVSENKATGGGSLAPLVATPQAATTSRVSRTEHSLTSLARASSVGSVSFDREKYIDRRRMRLPPGPGGSLFNTSGASVSNEGSLGSSAHLASTWLPPVHPAATTAASESPGISPLSDAFCTLQEAFLTVPEDCGFNIEVKYATSAEAALLGLRQKNRNFFVDRILDVVFAAYVRSQQAGKPPRPIIFSSFDPDVCVLLGRKQSVYPVFFLTEAGTPPEPYSDFRMNSLAAAVAHARSADLQGIVTNVAPLLACPELIKKVQEQGLVLASYGKENNILQNIEMQRNMGIGAIIMDHVAHIMRSVGKHTK